jgi:hypothetical protein
MVVGLVIGDISRKLSWDVSVTFQVEIQRKYRSFSWITNAGEVTVFTVSALSSVWANIKVI